MPEKRRSQPARVVWLADRDHAPADLGTATANRGLELQAVHSAPAVVAALHRSWVEDIVTVGPVCERRRAELKRTLDVYFPGVRIHHWQEPHPRSSTPTEGDSGIDRSDAGAEAGSTPHFVTWHGDGSGASSRSAQATNPASDAVRVTGAELDMLFGAETPSGGSTA